MFYYEKWVATADMFAAHIIDVTKLKNKSIMVTGATGLIGSAVLDMLIFLNETRFYQMELYATSRVQERVKERFRNFYKKPYFHIVSYDANKSIGFDFVVDYVIQAASNADPVSIQKFPVETLMSNVQGVQRILEYGKNNNIKRMLFISSSEVYGNNTTGKKFHENDYGKVDFLNPRASYPMGKRTGETLCAAYVDEYGFDAVIVRPGHIYGPTITEKDSRASAQFTRSALAGKDIVMKSNGRQLRSYCYVYDCVSAILTILLTGTAGMAYNISNKDSIVSIRDMAMLFAKYGKVQFVFETPSNEERASYNLMNMSALDATELEKLGWCAVANAPMGVEMTLSLMKG